MPSYNCLLLFLMIKVGEKLGKYEVEKRQAVENEDYDKAKLKKVQMDEYRLKVYKELDIKDLLEPAVSIILTTVKPVNRGHLAVQHCSFYSDTNISQPFILISE